MEKDRIKARNELLKKYNASSKGDILLSDLYMDYSNSEISKGMTEEEIRNQVTNIYTKVNSSFDQSFYKDQNSNKAKFDVNNFLSNMMGNFGRYANTPRKFSAEQINRIMEVPYSHRDELLRMSMYFYIKTQEYKGIIDYKSSMLTHTSVMDVDNMNNFDEQDYLDNLKFIDNYNLRSKLGQVTKLLVRDDVYFAYELSTNSKVNYTWKRLPNKYCRIIGKDRFETYRVGFDMSFFDTYPEQLKNFPDEFKEKHDALKVKNGKKKVTSLRDLGALIGKPDFVELNPDKAIAFKFDQSVDFVLPYYSGLFLDLVRLSDLKDIEISGTISDNYKLLHQKVPMGKDANAINEFLITGDFLTGFHDNLASNAPKDVGTVTSPMDITPISLKGNVNSAEENLTSKHVANIFTGSGTSSLLFNGASTSSLGLSKNIIVDESLMFRVLRQYELYMKKRLYLRNNNTYKYSLRFLDHTHLNEEALMKTMMTTGSAGFNTQFEVNAILGRSQIAFINNSSVIQKLGLNDIMQPFKSSHVGDGSEENGGTKTEGELTEDGINSREREL